MINFGMGFDTAVAFEDWDHSIQLGETDAQHTPSSSQRLHTSSEPPETEPTAARITELVDKTHAATGASMPKSASNTTLATRTSAARVSPPPPPPPRSTALGCAPVPPSPAAPASNTTTATTTTTASSSSSPSAASREHTRTRSTTAPSSLSTTSHAPVSSLSPSALTAVAAAVAAPPPPPLLQVPNVHERPASASSQPTPRAGAGLSRVSSTTNISPRAPTTTATTPSPASRYATLARATPSRYQVFFFHGCPHVLDHQTGLVISEDAFHDGAMTPATAASPTVAAVPAVHAFEPFIGAPCFRLPSLSTSTSAAATEASSASTPSMKAFLDGIAESVHATTLTFLANTR